MDLSQITSKLPPRGWLDARRLGRRGRRCSSYLLMSAGLRAQLHDADGRSQPGADRQDHHRALDRRHPLRAAERRHRRRRARGEVAQARIALAGAGLLTAQRSRCLAVQHSSSARALPAAGSVTRSRSSSSSTTRSRTSRASHRPGAARDPQPDYASCSRPAPGGDRLRAARRLAERSTRADAGDRRARRRRASRV